MHPTSAHQRPLTQKSAAPARRPLDCRVMPATTKKGKIMGWCSATVIFDNVCDGLLADKPQTQEETIMALAVALEDGDWDCQQDSAYWDHPVVQKVMRELHPGWFEDEA